MQSQGKEKSAGDQRKDNDLLLRNTINSSNGGSNAHHPMTINFGNETPTFRMRHASTSTLDLLNSNESGDDKSKLDNHQCAITTKNKSGVSNKLDFNNFFGMMRKGKDFCSKKSACAAESHNHADIQKDASSTHHVHSHRVGRLKAAKNVYFIDEPKDEPNIFIIDADSINKHKRVHYARKSLEDVFNHNSHADHHHRKQFTDDRDEPWNFANRTSYASRTLPRDFCRRNARAALHDVFDNHQHPQMNHQVER